MTSSLLAGLDEEVDEDGDEKGRVEKVTAAVAELRAVMASVRSVDFHVTARKTGARESLLETFADKDKLNAVLSFAMKHWHIDLVEEVNAAMQARQMT